MSERLEITLEPGDGPHRWRATARGTGRDGDELLVERESWDRLDVVKEAARAWFQAAERVEPREDADRDVRPENPTASIMEADDGTVSVIETIGATDTTSVPVGDRPPPQDSGAETGHGTDLVIGRRGPAGLARRFPIGPGTTTTATEAARRPREGRERWESTWNDCG